MLLGTCLQKKEIIIKNEIEYTLNNFPRIYYLFEIALKRIKEFHFVVNFFSAAIKIKKKITTVNGGAPHYVAFYWSSLKISGLV